MDNFTIKKKLFIFYICCVLVPLFMTDSFIIYAVVRSEYMEQQNRMERIADAVQYSFMNSIEKAQNIAEIICLNRDVNTFLSTRYDTHLAYVTAYQNFKSNILFSTSMSTDNIQIVLYANNDTIVKGGCCGHIGDIAGNDWYMQMLDSDMENGIFFLYDTSREMIGEKKRKVLFAQKMNYYDNRNSCDKMIVITLDYSTMGQNLVKMNYEMPVYICSGNRIILSNMDNSLQKDFVSFEESDLTGYIQNMELYGTDFSIHIVQPPINAMRALESNLLLIAFLIVLNIILPLILVSMINNSFTVRIRELSESFQRIEEEKMVEIKNVRGKDEIAELMYNYNRMVTRFNSLIQTVYISKLKEQEMMVAEQNAELLALHSQINPHFLFNALESIRMHSIIKNELETADMVEKLALLERRYLEWGDHFVEIGQEIKSVRDYLELQKYRFGDRLSYRLEVEDVCLHYQIPRMTIITFVENACVHGIESKTTPGWIFLRIFESEGCLCIEVEDTGRGMETELLKTLEYDMNHVSIEMLKHRGRIGIKNTCLRLKMTTKDAVLFQLDGEEGMGFMVSIKIPLYCLQKGEEIYA